MGDRFEWNGYSYETKAEWEETKREEEAIRYIRAKTDLTNPDVARKVYLGLVQKKTFVTPAGMEFMRQLREQLLASATEAGEVLPGIPVKIIPKKSKNVQGFEAENESKSKAKAVSLEGKLHTARILNIVMVLVIVAMFLITLFGPNSMLVDAEVKLQNKYAAWEQQLTERENALAQREQSMK